VFGGIVMQGAFGPGVKARITMLITSQALWPEPSSTFEPLFIDINDQSMTKVFCFPYVNAFDIHAIHRNFWPCKPRGMGVD
jgi:hypothetical protein